MNKTHIFTIAKKEFLGFINSPLAYIIIVPFLIISNFLYFRTAFVVGDASLRSYFQLLPWFLLFLAPALAMNLLSDEQRKGTLELLFGHPLQELDIILGKFLGVLTFFAVLLIMTFSLPLTLFLFAKPDPGLIISQYLGGVFLGATFLAVGLMASAYIKNNIGSFLLALALNFILILIGLDMVVLFIPWPFSRLLQELALLPHVESISRGVLEAKDLVYFFSLSTIFLVLTLVKLAERRTKDNKRERLQLHFIGLSLVILCLGVNILFNFFPLRIDLTKDRLFTLSKGTKQTLNKIPDKVTITVYAVKNLPGQAQLILRQLTDILKDYKRLSKNIELVYKYPDTDSKIMEEAQTEGIQEVTFNRVGSTKFEAQNGFLGIKIQSGEKKEIIPFVENTADLEYQLTRRIRKVTNQGVKTLGWYSNDIGGQYQIFEATLKTQYEIKDINLSQKEELTSLDGLIVIDNNSSEEIDTASNLKSFLNNKGKVLLLTKGVTVDPQLLVVDKGKSKINEVVASYGIDLQNDLVYDLELNETVTLGQGAVRYLLPYPFWLKALPNTTNFPFTAHIDSVLMAWPSSLKLSQKDNFKPEAILETSLNAGRETENFNISPNSIGLLAPSIREKIVLGAVLEKEEMRLAVLADQILASDQFVNNSPQNLSFVIGLIDWLVADEELAAIPIKTSARAVFLFTNSLQPVIVQYANIFAPSLLIIIFAFVWLTRRKKLTLRKYDLSVK